MSDALLGKPTPKTIALLELCKRKKFTLASGPRFSTKCVAPDTLVWTPSGIIEIGDMGKANVAKFSQINADVVSLSKNGHKIQMATARLFYNSGFREARQVKTHNGYEVVCSPEHPIWSECGGSIEFRTSSQIQNLIASGKEVWLPLMRQNEADWTQKNQVVEYAWHGLNDKIKIEASNRIHKAMAGGAKSIEDISRIAGSAISTTKKRMDNPIVARRDSITVDEDIGYLIGLFIGDGGYSKPVIDRFRTTLTTADEQIAIFAKHVIESRFTDSKFEHENNKTNSYGYLVRSASFRQFLREIGTAGKYSYEKEVPKVILKSSKPVIRAFLQGLFDTDGMVCKQGQARYCSTSERLAKQVQSLLLCLGIRSRRNFTKNAYRGAWLVCVKSEDDFANAIGFRLERKQNRLLASRKFHQTRMAYPPSLITLLKKLHSNRKSRGVGELPRLIHKRIISSVFRENLALSKARLEPLVATLKCESDPEFKKYWIEGKVWWDKVASCETTESELVDISVPDTENFIGNGFINHNTVACLLCVCDHAYRTRKANIIIVTVSQSAGMDSGVWADLIDIVIPAFGLSIKKKPYVQSVSKKPAVEVWNQYGEGVKIQLESLKDEDDVEKRFKGKRYSMMYVPELSNFKRRKTFDVWGECLRMVHLPDEQHLFLADTNPADEGDKSWIYHIWYMLRTADEFDPRLRALRDQLGLIEYDLSDNVYSSKERIEEVKARYAHDPDLYDRYVLGKWVTASEDGLFNKVFKPNIHVVGEVESPTNKVPMLMIPQSGCIELGGGWDMGIRNSAFQIVEKYFVSENFTLTLESGEKVKSERLVSIFKVLDELVIVGEDFELRDFVEAALRKMEYWEDYIGHPVQWTHWSDRSAFEMKSNGELQHKETYLISNGKIVLQAAERSREMVKQRIDLYRKLLFQDRVFISAKCEKTIEMTKSLKKGRGQFSIIQKESPHKHPFDSLTYYLLSECREEINLAIRKGFQPAQEESGVIAIGL